MLPINGLDFDEIKANFIKYLKTQNFYTDYNFEASGISSIINLLSYIAHYIGYYIKMALTESFIDGATRRESLMSKAKLTSYLPKSKRSARATVTLKTIINGALEPTSSALIIPKYSHFTGTNNVNDLRSYYVLSDVICTTRTVRLDNVAEYISPEFSVYEGVLKTWKFEVNSSIPNQRFIINNSSIDTDTISVYVYQDKITDNKQEYMLATNASVALPSDNIFYLSANEEGLYEIFFGNNVIGSQPKHGNIIEVVYLSSSGESGNGCTSMVFQRPSNTEFGTVGYYTSFVTTVKESSKSGMEAEDIESLRKNIPNSYRMQKRIVTETDYRDVLIEKFRDIDSINVWGGEKNFPKENGTVFISIKPKYSSVLGNAAKNEILSLIKSYGVVGLIIKIVDPEYINVSININAKYNTSVTNKSVGEVKRIIVNKVNSYNQQYLDNFNKGLSNIDLLDYIRADQPYINRIYSTSKISKNVPFVYLSTTEYIVNFGNKLQNKSISSNRLLYASKNCILTSDTTGNVWLTEEISNKNTTIKPIGSIDYKQGIIKFVLNLNIKSSVDYGTNGIISITATPELPDIDTFLHNIVIISDTTVTVNDNG